MLCGICLDEVHVILEWPARCKHYFCAKCTRQWLERSAACPFCRREDVPPKPDPITPPHRTVSLPTTPRRPLRQLAP